MHAPFLTRSETEVKVLFSSSLLVHHGYLAVDGFFVLTGFLIAESVLPLLQPGADVRAFLSRYYASRVLRIMIPYVITAALFCGWMGYPGSYRTGLVRLQAASASFERFFGAREFVDNGCGTFPANLLHLNMLMPFNGCFVHAWSVGVQFHSYLWLPLLLLWAGVRPGNLRSCAWFVAIACVICTAFRVGAQYHHSMFANGSVLGSMLELWHYSNTMMRTHVIIIGVGAAWLSRDARFLAWMNGAAAKARAGRAGMWLLAAAFFATTAGWSSMVGDYRYERNILHSFYVAFGCVGSVTSGVVWAWLLLCALHRRGIFAANSFLAGTQPHAAIDNKAEVQAVPEGAADAKEGAADAKDSDAASSTLRRRGAAAATGTVAVAGEPRVAAAASDANPSPPAARLPSPVGLGISAFLASKPLAVLADLSYWSYLLHVVVQTALFSEPWALYPPSAGDFAPASLVGDHVLANGTIVQAITSIVNSNATFIVPRDESLRSRALWAWFELRQSILPAGASLSMNGILMMAAIAFAATLALCWVLLHYVETPLRNALVRRCGGAVTRVSWWYAMTVMVVGVLAHAIALGGMFVWVRPELEATWLPPVGGNVTNSTASAAANGTVAAGGL